MPRHTATGNRDDAMEFAYPTMLLVPLGLGLLGFVEPCTIGAHLLLLRALDDGGHARRWSTLLLFALVRAVVFGAVGVAAAWLGRHVVAAQTTMWLVFGAVYIAVGAAYAGGFAGLRLRLAPAAWRAASRPLPLALAFGLSIPACAAPILFGLIGLAAGTGTLLLGFATMALFAIGLSAPLFLLVATGLGTVLQRWMHGRRALVRRAIAVVFVALGAWSIWFGLFVDPAAWSQL